MKLEELVDKLLKYITVLLTMRSGWTVKVLNDKTFEFRKRNVSKRMSRGQMFVERFCN